MSEFPEDPKLEAAMKEAVAQAEKLGIDTRSGARVHILDGKITEDEISPEFVYVDPLKDWVVSGSLRLQDGRLTVSRLVIEPNTTKAHAEEGVGPPKDGIGSADLRAIPFGRILALARAELLNKPNEYDFLNCVWRQLGISRPEPAEVRAAQSLAHQVAATRKTKRGRKSEGDDRYRDIALEYLELQTSGVVRGILGELAIRHNRPRDTMRDWVRQARVRGFLTAGSPGRAGAEPGPKLYVDAEREGERAHEG